MKGKEKIFIDAVYAARQRGRRPTLKTIFNCRPVIKEWDPEEIEKTISNLVCENVIKIKNDKRKPAYEPSLNFDVHRNSIVTLNNGVLDETAMIEKITLNHTEEKIK